MKKDLIIIGASTPTIIRVIDDINQSGRESYNIIGFVDSNWKSLNKDFYGIDLIGGFDSVNSFSGKNLYLINTIAGDMKIRKEVTQYFLNSGFNFTNIIHPSINLNRVSLGVGNLVYENSMIHPFVTIGNHNVISSNSGLAHETKISDYVFVGPASYICGKCKIGDGVYIGVGSKVLPRLTLGEYSTVAAGAVVTRDVAAYSKVYGIPAELK